MNTNTVREPISFRQYILVVAVFYNKTVISVDLNEIKTEKVQFLQTTFQWNV